MATLDVRRDYADGDILYQADLDNFLDDVETFLNVTKINDDNIQNAGITASSKLVDASISTAKIADSAVTEAKIAASAVTTSRIADGNITLAKMNTDSVSTSNLVNGCVTTDKLGTAAVTEAKIATGAVTASRIADGNVTLAKLDSNSVGTSNIVDGAVTYAKRAALTRGTASGSGSYSTSSTSFVDVTNQSVSFTTTGRPLLIFIRGDEAGTMNVSSATANSTLKILRDANTVLSVTIGQSGPLGPLMTMESPSAGTYTYKVQVAANSGGTCSAAHIRLEVVELG